MPELWTAVLVGTMHRYNITANRLAEQVGWNPKYLSAVLNGHRSPKNAERALTRALNALIDEAAV